MLTLASTRRSLAAALLCLPLVCLNFGCGGSSGLSKTEETSSEHLALREIAEAYRVYTITNSKPPKQISDLASMEALGANGLKAVRDGKLVVRMGAKLPDTSEEAGKVTSTEVLAYESQTPQEGGYVLLLDRNIRKMTADEFKAATLAGVEAPAEKKAAGKTK